MHQFLLIFIFLSSLCCFGQTTLDNNNTDTVKTDGYVVIVKDASIDEIINLYKQNNITAQGTEGYRVQIYNDSGNNARNRAMEVKEAFEKAFPQINAYLQYQQPNFKVRVGDSRTKLEAYKIQKDIASKFSDAFVVKDFIKR